MEFKNLEEQLYHLYCSSEFENIISIARKEFLKGNKEICVWTYLASAYCPSKFYSTNRKRGYFLSKIALNLVNKELKKERTENLVFYCAILNINLGNDDKITKYCNELIKMNPNNYYSCGVLYNLSWNRKKAFNCFKKSAELTQYAHYYYNRGYAKYSLNNFQEAIEDYTKAIELKSDNERYYYWRAIAKNCLKDTQGALEDFNKAIELNPNVTDFYEDRGVTNFRLKNYKESIEDDTKAIQLCPFAVQAYFNRGTTKLHLKDYQESIKDITKAIELESNNDYYYFSRAIVKNRIEDYQGEIEDYTMAIELNPDNSDYYDGRGMAKKELKDYEGAIEDYSKAIELNPNNADYYMGRAMAKENLNNHKEAIEDCDKAIILLNTWDWPYHFKATILETLGFYEKAIETMNDLLVISKNNFGAYLYMGSIYKSIKDYSNAINCFDKCIEIIPQDTEIYLEKAQSLFHIDVKQALDFLLTVQKKCKFGQDTIFTALSFVYFSQKNYKKALKYADEAIMFNKDNGTGYYRKHCALFALGKQNEAREFYEKANALGYEETF